MYRNSNHGKCRTGNVLRSGRSVKRVAAILLSVMLTVGMSLTAYAEEEGQTPMETQQAEQAGKTTAEPVSEEKEEPAVAADEEMAEETDKEDAVDAAITGEAATVKEDTESEESASFDEEKEVPDAADTLEEDASEEIGEGEADSLMAGTTSTWLSDYGYSVQNGRVKLTSYNGNDIDIIVPGSAVINGTAYNTIEISRGLWNNARSLSFEDGVVFPNSCNLLFYNMTSLTAIDLSKVDTSNVTDMGGMFMDCSGLSSLDLSGVDTKNVTNMLSMFRGCSGLTSLNLSGIDTGKVTNMNCMFYDCSGLTGLDLSNFNTGNVTNMAYMFYNCPNLVTLDVTSFNTEKVTDMTYMFYSCSGLGSLDVSGFSTGNVTSMFSMFQDCSSLTNLDVSGFDTANVSTMASMFYNCENLRNLDVSGFETSNVYDMHSMFAWSEKLSFLDVSGFNTGNVENVYGMFNGCTNLQNLDVSGFQTENVTDMSFMFSECTSLRNLDVSGFDTGNVTDMRSMFNECAGLRNIDVSGFDTGNVTDMKDMFSNCSSLTTLDMSGFDLSNIQDPIIYAMFSNCDALWKINAPVGVTILVELQYEYNGSDGNVYDCLPQNQQTSIVLTRGTGESTAIIEQPASVTAQAGQSVTFSIDASGSGLTYQWQYNTGTGSDWTDFANATGNTMTQTPSADWDGWQVRCVITDSDGNTVISDPAVITVEKEEEIGIISQPVSVTTAAGSNISFSVTATGTGLIYQWQYQGKSSTRWTDFTNATASTLSKTPSASWDGWKVRCVITDSSGNTAVSESATITIQETIHITSQPVSATARAGESVNFSVAATGSGLTYQWQYQGRTSTKWTNFANATNRTMTKTPSASWDGWKVRCVITDSIGNTAASDIAVITIEEEEGIEITSQPVSVTAQAGKSVSFSVTATSSGLTYQWQYQGRTSTKWTNFANATSCTMTKTPSASWDGWKVRCVVTDSSGHTATSDIAVITIEEEEGIEITSQPVSVTTQAGKSVSFSVTATGSGLTYQWQYQGRTSTKWTNFANATSAVMTKTPSASWDGWKVRCVVTDSSGNTMSSEIATVTIETWLSDYSYTLNGDRIVLTGYSGTATAITVPGSAVIDGVRYDKVEIGRGIWGNVESLSFERGVVLPDNSYGLFQNMTALKSVDLSKAETANVTNMSNMFYACSNLITLNLEGMNTSNVTKMTSMFQGCNSLTNLDVSSFDTSKVTDMAGMFNSCRGLTSLDLNNFNTANVTKMNGMFLGSNGLTSLDLSCFDTSNVTTMSGMFTSCSGLRSLNLQGFSTGNVTQMGGMFSDCSSLTSLDVSGFDTSKVTTMAIMFNNCSSLTSLDISSFDFAKVTNTNNMLYRCTALNEIQVPTGLTRQVSLPGTFLDPDGREYTYLPRNLLQSVKLTLVSE